MQLLSSIFNPFFTNYIIKVIVDHVITDYLIPIFIIMSTSSPFSKMAKWQKSEWTHVKWQICGLYSRPTGHGHHGNCSRWLGRWCSRQRVGIWSKLQTSFLGQESWRALSASLLELRSIQNQLHFGAFSKGTFSHHFHVFCVKGGHASNSSTTLGPFFDREHLLKVLITTICC